MKPHPFLKKIGWNRKTLTQNDFDLACEEMGVLTADREMSWDGVYFVRQGYPIILLSRKLIGAKRLFVAWHEFAHHLYDSPNVMMFASGLVNKCENRANIVGLCAILPKALICRPMLPYSEELVIPDEIFGQRLKILREYGI